MNNAFIALGSNIEPRKEYLKVAIDTLSEDDSIFIRKKSSIYETAPVGYTDQSDFLNMVIEIDTSRTSYDLLRFCQKLEQKLGRDRKIRFGPRTIDLDILIYNQENSEIESLIIPHPRMHERAFVLIPLDEIAPGLIIPTWGKRVRDFLKELPASDIRDVTKWMQNESAEG
ncbi:2-amino-4-hydroxy-6-hydroxymethyldihydropteridine diphosphokinase [Virgibacillus sp. NKC19-16]|uniref:2-amino-4-hydroxy-6- hydroxymethyldihydropteridine diphosphokinase n=1 Tax=Virgibacillus salidurans TaxID=2831673 RepID=UPI001F3C7092|nr:2-amino-4-hydroxy-6-hydroxymethyldihydropteridine diphosphokinase [Virgibacillus sp. NKC19-16]UJL46513.1 2-amino-4-hydroxy-6-hydroxymethyldihydropteridine diphosphokinase [Virgibacillus sp. NKC19-16]